MKKARLLIPIIFVILLTILLLCMQSSKNIKEYSRTAFYFDTSITITLYEGSSNQSFEDIVNECFSICKYYENLISVTEPDSEISNINLNSKTNNISDDTSSLINSGLYYSKLTDGAFDITTYPLSKLWNFKNNTGTIPSDASINKTLELVDYNYITLQNNTITKKNENTMIDLGGIAKGYIADKLKNYLKEAGITSGLINLGGNILAIGSKPDGSNFNIAIKKPFSGNEHSAIVSCKDISIVTSGVYERYFESDQKIYHHILDPDTGYPCDNSLYSVTIITSNSTTADALSTGCFVLGLDDGMKLIESLENVEAIFIDNNYSLHISSGLSMNNDNKISLK